MAVPRGDGHALRRLLAAESGPAGFLGHGQGRFRCLQTAESSGPAVAEPSNLLLPFKRTTPGDVEGEDPSDAERRTETAAP